MKCSEQQSHVRSLMLCAVADEEAGKHKRTTIKVTHATAMIPMGMYHFPKENGPGVKRERPEVMRRKIGVA
jgi:hypothetical protein